MRTHNGWSRRHAGAPACPLRWSCAGGFNNLFLLINNKKIHLYSNIISTRNFVLIIIWMFFFNITSEFYFFQYIKHNWFMIILVSFILIYYQLNLYINWPAIYIYILIYYEIQLHNYLEMEIEVVRGNHYCYYGSDDPPSASSFSFFYLLVFSFLFVQDLLCLTCL